MASAPRGLSLGGVSCRCASRILSARLRESSPEEDQTLEEPTGGFERHGSVRNPLHRDLKQLMVRFARSTGGRSKKKRPSNHPGGQRTLPWFAVKKGMLATGSFSKEDAIQEGNLFQARV